MIPLCCSYTKVLNMMTLNIIRYIFECTNVTKLQKREHFSNITKCVLTPKLYSIHLKFIRIAQKLPKSSSNIQKLSQSVILRSQNSNPKSERLHIGGEEAFNKLPLKTLPNLLFQVINVVFSLSMGSKPQFRRCSASMNVMTSNRGIKGKMRWL